MLLAILSGFTYNIMSSGLLFFIVGLLPLAFIIAFCGLVSPPSPPLPSPPLPPPLREGRGGEGTPGRR